MENTFIVLEGIDGAGKTTVSNALASAIEATGNRVVCIRSLIGDYELSANYVNEFCDIDAHYLFYLSCVLHTSDRIRSLIKDTSVVCDRYIFSTLAYHRANPRPRVSIDLSKVQIYKPDYAFYLYVSDENVRRRRLSERSSKTPGDRGILSDNGLVSIIESEFKRFKLTWIDTTNSTVEDTTRKIMDRIQIATKRGVPRVD